MGAGIVALAMAIVGLKGGWPWRLRSQSEV